MWLSKPPGQGSFSIEYTCICILTQQICPEAVLTVTLQDTSQSFITMIYSQRLHPISNKSGIELVTQQLNLNHLGKWRRVKSTKVCFTGWLILQEKRMIFLIRSSGIDDQYYVIIPKLSQMIQHENKTIGINELRGSNTFWQTPSWIFTGHTWWKWTIILTLQLQVILTCFPSLLATFPFYGLHEGFFTL